MTKLVLVCCLLFPTLAMAGTYRALTRDGSWGDYEAFPDVCLLKNGDSFVVFYGGTGHVTLPSEKSPRGGAIYGLRSTGSGKTWSAPLLVADTPEDDRDPHVCQLRDGSLLATFFTYKPYKGPGPWSEEGDVYVVRSTDGGLTWGNPQRVPTPYKDKQGLAGVFESGSPVQLKGNHVILPLYVEKTKGHYVTAIVHSTDGGKTWGKVSEVDSEQSLAFSYGFCEGAVTRVSDGRLIILMRPGMHQAYSSDEGYTWTKATRLPVAGDAPGVLLTSRKLLLATFRYKGTSAMISTNDGATWGKPWRIDTVGGAYSNQVELEDGSILCIYYEEGT
ncbi:MAG: exo-alpha-sialidase, partial [Armatimonadetes bacterium]|nr:exo-alpha-sialidase [Armatimonadota bacterium]